MAEMRSDSIEDDLPDVTSRETGCALFFLSPGPTSSLAIQYLLVLFWTVGKPMFLTVELLSKNNRNTWQETFNSTTVDFGYLLDVTKQIHELKICMHKSQAHPHFTDAMKGRHWLPLHHLHGLFPPMGYKLFLLLTIMFLLGTKRL